MRKLTTAIILSLALAASPLSATPARAGSNDDFGRIVAGTIALLIIGNAIRDQNIKGKHVPVTRDPVPQRPHFSRFLPRECYFVLRDGNDLRGVYGKTCTTEIMRGGASLPAACADRVPVRYGRKADVYDARCLRQRGYVVEARLP